MLKAFLAIAMLSLPSFASAGESSRAANPMFKGVELYSWKVSSSNSWRFALCDGTNRNKTLTEIRHKCHIMRNLGSLKNRLSKLAVGEYVMWSSPYPELTLPPDAILQDVKAHAISQQIKLVIAE